MSTIKITPDELIEEAKANSTAEWEKEICEMIILLPETLRLIMHMLLDDFDYYKYMESDQAAAARSIAVLIYRLNQSLIQDGVSNEP